MVLMVDRESKGETSTVVALPTSCEILIRGQVQGVGFRPFVFALAKQFDFCGQVRNNAEGVQIILSTDRHKAKAFVDKILLSKPKHAQISSIEIKHHRGGFYSDFQIVNSLHGPKIDSPLTPDLALCKDCQNEIQDPENKRYHYPFTSCVSCGPRYAITQNFPFEREHTSMSAFPLCASCLEEYSNPHNKRFHAQTISCPQCGIQLTLTNNKKEPLLLKQKAILKKVAHFILAGHCIALKNTSGYLLCCDAEESSAIEKLRKRKQRPAKPFAVMYPSLKEVEKSFYLSLAEAAMLTSSAAPIVLLKNKKTMAIATRAIAPQLNKTGVMLPSSPLLKLLADAVGKPMVITSGNLHQSAIACNEKEAYAQLCYVADYFLHHNLEIVFPQDDSLVQFQETTPIFLRRSRGFSPNISFNSNTKTHENVFAAGAHQKSSFAFWSNQTIYLSQYFGKLDDLSVFNRYKETVQKYQGLLKQNPAKMMVDKHPSYQSRAFGVEWAKTVGAEVVEVQHHLAHFLSVLGEHQLLDSSEKILGVIWDGNGWGEDGNIWGGEFFTYRHKIAKRVEHFRYFPWIANEKMAREPRIALMCLCDHPTIAEKFTANQWSNYKQLKQKSHLKTSSVGRMFDAAASALGLIDVSSYEGQAALLLEQCAGEYKENIPLALWDGKTNPLNVEQLISAVLAQLRLGESKERIAYSFHCALVESILWVAKKQQVKRLACSGGVFQNALLMSLLKRKAEENNLRLFFNRSLSPNDENIAFGQIIYDQLKNSLLCV